MENDTLQLLDVKDVAMMFKVSVPTIRKWIADRKIPYQKIHGVVRFTATEMQEWSKSKTVLPLHDKNAKAKEVENDDDDL